MLHSYLDQTLSFFRLAPLIISKDSFLEFVARFDCYSKNNSEPEHYSKFVQEQIKAYQEDNNSVHLTSNYADDSIPDSIAVHFIEGFIAHDKNWWYCSSEQLIEDINTAEQNDKIIGHLIVVNSPGGESYGLEKVNEHIRSLNKPIITAVKKLMASAGLYIGVSADKVYCLNKFDIVGSIGCMVSYWDAKKALENYGYTLVEAYATKSTHKNKIGNDLASGKADQYIKRFLDPLQDEFEACVKISRPKTLKAPEDSHLFNGEIFYAEEAKELGIIDGVKNLEEIITELHELGKEYQTRSKILITNYY